MIPRDEYTTAVAFLLLLMGVIGLLKPAWFVILSRFPFMFPFTGPDSVTAPERRRARRWGVATLAGAAILVAIAGR